jgi:hypothetical protein
MIQENNTKYLVGQNAKLNYFISPFNEEVIDFLNDFSESLIINNKNNLPDVKTLSFFCRKNNILNLKKKYLDHNNIRYGLGLLFHITPSNIPTNFAYSLIFGLICGNSNIVKVPSRDFKEIEIICDSLKKVLTKTKYLKIKNMITVVRYSNNDNLTSILSLKCDGRLIWGGDKTISKIKEFQTKPRNIDIAFADRYSISIINSDSYFKLPQYKKLNLARNFYNDTYAVDQNACSSPHILIWKGKFIKKAKVEFWNVLNNLVQSTYSPPDISFIDNYSRLASDLIKNKNIQNYKCFSKSLYVITLKKPQPETIITKSIWGFFYECSIKNLKDLKYLTNKKLQTLTYYGFSKKFLKSFFHKNNLEGIDRIVPIGQALNIDLTWDGYDLTKVLSRVIDVR